MLGWVRGEPVAEGYAKGDPAVGDDEGADEEGQEGEGYEDDGEGHHDGEGGTDDGDEQTQGAADQCMAGGGMADAAEGVGHEAHDGGGDKGEEEAADERLQDGIARAALHAREFDGDFEGSAFAQTAANARLTGAADFTPGAVDASGDGCRRAKGEAAVEEGDVAVNGAFHVQCAAEHVDGTGDAGVGGDGGDAVKLDELALEGFLRGELMGSVDDEPAAVAVLAGG